jgi:glutamine amidotransferase
MVQRDKVSVAGIVDLGICNLGSLVSALSRMRLETAVISNNEDLENFSHIILPGVGGFAEAAARLRARGLYVPLRESISSGKPFLGICLGMQLMAEEGFEGIRSIGLRVNQGTVSALQSENGARVPHVGWNSVNFEKFHPVFEGIPDGTDFYFVHGFAVSRESEEEVIARTRHGVSFPSSIGRGSAIGVQFHPEKSQTAGMQLLSNFFEWDGRC